MTENSLCAGAEAPVFSIAFRLRLPAREWPLQPARDWYERVWKNFHPGLRNFSYVKDQASLYESIVTVPKAELPVEISRCSWPEGWIHD
jgi:hypothetical protein